MVKKKDRQIPHLQFIYIRYLVLLPYLSAAFREPKRCGAPIFPSIQPTSLSSALILQTPKIGSTPEHTQRCVLLKQNMDPLRGRLRWANCSGLSSP